MASARDELERLRGQKFSPAPIEKKSTGQSFGARKELERLRTKTPIEKSVSVQDTISPTTDPSFLERLQQIGSAGPSIQDIPGPLQLPLAPATISRFIGQKSLTGADKEAVAITEGLAERGLPPEIATLAGTTALLGPDILGFAGGAGGIRRGKEIVKKVLGSKAIGKKLGQIEKTAGITSKLPSKQVLAKDIGLKGKPEFATIANRTENLIDGGFGTNLSNETLKSFIKKSKSILKRPEFTDKAGRFTPEGTDLLRIKDKAESALNLKIRGRAGLQQQFAQAAQRERILSAVLRGTGKTARVIGKGAAILGLGAAGFRGAQTFFGG
jgi:hypothetical protein